ncbi:MAG: heme-dependent oxidative N-demethylase subunit alpha family protein [Rubrivivax sp.]
MTDTSHGAPAPASANLGFDFDAAVQAPFRMQPGLRRLAEGAMQLHACSRDSRHLHEKLLALSAVPPPALQCTPGFDAMPALHTLARQAATEHAQAFGWDGDTALARELGWAVRGSEVLEFTDGPAPLPQAGACLRRLPPAWRLGGLLALAFAEDFAVIDGGTAHIPWLAVALPSHWAPEQKIGLHFAQVHAPVADNQILLAAGDALARMVSSRARWERFVWNVTANPKLNAHPASAPAPRWAPGHADAVAAQAWWRTERQTFIPVEGVAQAVFTILVDTQPLAQAIDSAAKATRLHDALASMSPAVLQYRSLTGVRDPLLHWLARRASA